MLGGGGIDAWRGNSTRGQPARLDDEQVQALCVQIQYPSRLELIRWIAREDPAAMRPRPDRCLVQPVSHRAVADARDQPALLDLASVIGNAQPRQRWRLPAGSWASEVGRDAWCTLAGNG